MPSVVPSAHVCFDCRAIRQTLLISRLFFPLRQAFYFWSLASNAPCCSSPDPVAACPAASVILPVYLEDLGSTGAVPTYELCDFDWSLQRSFACLVPQAAAVVFAANGATTPDGRPLQLLFFPSAVPYWTAVQRCDVLASRLLSLPDDSGLWGPAADAAWPEGSGRTAWAVSGGVNCSLAQLGGGSVSSIAATGEALCDTTLPFVCVRGKQRDTGSSAPDELSNTRANKSLSSPGADTPLFPRADGAQQHG